MNISQREEFRYWYAGLAMQAVIQENRDVKETVRLALEFADALIAELNKKGGEK